MSCNKSDLCLIAAMMVYLAIGGGSKGLLSHFRSIQPIIYMQAFLLQWSAKLGQPLVEPAALKPRLSCNAEWYDTGAPFASSYLH